MKFPLTALIGAWASAGCTDHAARERLGIGDGSVLKTGTGAIQNEAAGAVNAQWINPRTSIKSRCTTPVSLQARLDQTPGDKTEYFHTKAQCWIDAARQAHDTHDNWGFVEESIGRAAIITMNLERGTPVSALNPMLRIVSMMRPDPWTFANTIEADVAAIHCPQAQAPLDLKEAGATRELTITRYTGRLGDDACNQRLSLLRVRTVEQYLRTRGVPLLIVVQGQGSENSRAERWQTKRDQLVRCFAPHHRVEMELAGAAS
jgi:hypothetical protein